MNETAMKGLLKIIKSMVPPETIKQAANTLLKSAIDFKNEIVLDEGETAAVSLIYEVDNVVYCCMACMNNDNQVVRFISVNKMDELIDNLLKKM
jgi:hypothetical protein